MEIQKYFIFAVAATLTLATGVLHAQGSVVGQLQAESSVVLNPGSAQQRIGNQEFPYLQGDIVSTMGAKTASIILSSGQSVLTMAPDSVISVDAAAPLAITLSAGGFGVQAAPGLPITIDSPQGTFRLTSDNGADVVAVVEDGNFAVVPKQGTLMVENIATGAIVALEERTALLVNGETQSKIVDVAIGGAAASTCLGMPWAVCVALGLVAGYAIYDANKNDPPPTSP